MILIHGLVFRSSAARTYLLCDISNFSFFFLFFPAFRFFQNHPNQIYFFEVLTISAFHKEYPEKPIVTSLPLDSVPSMTRPTVPKEPKQKLGRPCKRAK